MTSVRTEYGKNAVVAGEDYLLYYNPAEKFDGSSRLIVCTHGHNATASQWVQSHQSLGRHASALVRSGRYMVLAVAADGGVAWAHSAALSSINAGVVYGRSRGAKSGKYGLMGYSMGGLTVFNQIKRDAANIAGAQVWSPLTDLTWAYNAGNATWTNEIIAAYGTWAATAGHRVADEPGSFSGLTVPVKVIHATDDATVPYSQTTSFLSAVNNPLLQLHQPDITGGHTGLFQNTSDEETVAFFDSLDWEGASTPVAQSDLFADIFDSNFV